MKSSRSHTHRRWLVAPLFALACEAANATTAPYNATQNISSSSEKIAGGGGVGLATYEAGKPGAPAIVLIHGFTQNSMTWDRQFRELAERFHVVTYDLRGHGASDKPLEGEKYKESALWADDLAAVIRAKNLQRPVLVGWSYGGYIIADYVRKYGDAGLGGLVFVDAVTKQGTEEAAGYFTEEVLGIFGDVLSADLRTSMNASRTLTGMFAPRDAWDVAFGSAMMVPPAVRLAMFSRVLDNDDVLARIRVPTLVLQGSRDRLVKVSAAEHIAKTINGAKLTVYNGLGHAPQLEHSARFNRDLIEFVSSLR